MNDAFITNLPSSRTLTKSLTGVNFTDSLNRGISKAGGVGSVFSINNNFQVNASVFGGNQAPKIVRTTTPPSKEPPSRPQSSGKGGGGGKGRTSGRPRRGLDPQPYLPKSEPNSASVTFSSGLSGGTIVNKMGSSDNVDYSKLFVLNGAILPDLNTHSITNHLLNTLIFQQWRIQIVDALRPKSYNYVTKEKFNHYLSKLIDALQAYYMIQSIYTYGGSRSRGNVGMLHLSERLTMDVLSAHESLDRTLCDFACPPRLLAYINFIYNNFTPTPSGDGVIYRLGFRDMLMKGGVIDASHIRIIEHELRDCSEFNSMLRAAMPHYIIGTLPPVSADPIYSLEFLNFWHNSTISYMDKDSSKISYTRDVKDHTSEFYYGRFTPNDVDAVFYGMTNIYVNSTESIEAGLWVPYNDAHRMNILDINQRCNLLCYDYLSNDLTAVKSSRVLAQSGIFHGAYLSEDTYRTRIYNHSDAAMLQANCLYSVNSSLTDSILWLLDRD